MIVYRRRCEVVQPINTKKSDLPFKPRLITHPNFHNVTKEAAEEMLKERNVGEFILRPSTRGFMFLSIAWKISKTKISHFAVEELDKKPNDPEVAKKLRIRKETYEDLDEIVGRYITPINAWLADVYSSEKFKDVDLAEAKKLCNDAKEAEPQRIPYFLIPYENSAGTLILVYRPGSTVRRALVTVTPEGYKFEGKVFKQFAKVVAYFKANYKRIGVRR